MSMLSFGPTRSAVRLSNPLRSPTRSRRFFSSVDPQEVSHFTELASSWWDPHGPSRLLHLMNPLRHQFLRRCQQVGPLPHDHHPAPPPPTDSSSSGQRKTYLDIGCGGGIFAESAARLSDTRYVVAIDPTPAVLAVARAHAQRDPWLADTTSGTGKLTYLPTSIEDLGKHWPPAAAFTSDDSQERPGEASESSFAVSSTESSTVASSSSSSVAQFDVVTVFEVLEHVEDPAGFLARVARHVRPGGWLVLSTIARTWTSWLVTNVVAEDLLRIVPRGTHDWHKYQNVADVRGYLRAIEQQQQQQPQPMVQRTQGEPARPSTTSTTTTGPIAESSTGDRGRIAWDWDNVRCEGVVYVPGLGWSVVPRSEAWGNYFLGVRRL